jgi:uncharacterized protein DUF6580
MAYWLIALAVLCRLIPHPPNVTPVLAVALFGGATLSRRTALAVPLLAMFLSDLALGYPFGWMNLVVYACFLTGVWLGRFLGARSTWRRRVAAALSGSVIFFLATNFAVWLGSEGSYDHTLDGFMRCYVLALPFFRNSLLGDLAWSIGLFGLHDLARAWTESRCKGTHGVV